MRKYMGWMALASGAAAALGTWSCGSSVKACEETGGCMEESDSSALDASPDSPLVQATLPDSAEAAVDDKKEGGADKKTADDATPETADVTPETADGSIESAPEGSTEASAKCTPGAAPANNGCITDASGVFVATVAKGGSDTAGTGSMEQPFATMTRALANLGTNPAIYVCGGGYIDQVTVNTPLSIYGGLTCAGGKWGYLAGAVAAVTGSSASFALQIAVTTGAVDLEDIEIDGATAAAGESSIAAWVKASSNVSLHRVKVVGGIGGAGANAGAATPNYTAATAPVGGAGTGDVALGTPILAALGGVNTCVDGTTSHGGVGGGSYQSPYTIIGTSGLPSYGTPDPVTSTGAAAPQPTNLVCGTTFPGSDGEGGGTAGADSASAGEWSLSASAWIPSVSGKGANGGSGQGGGGGNVNNGDSSGNGAGGGGSGGCGGAGGLGGTSGGASFGLLSIDSAVTLDQCTITSGLAGNGGNGSQGQAGQGPGAGGPGGWADTTCYGAQGGYGQGGGGGAGGSAGASVALAYVGTKPVYGSDTHIAAFGTAATPGAGGTAGASDPALLTGDPNLAAKGAHGAAIAPVAVMLLPTQ
jgi:hypothetical protein